MKVDGASKAGRAKATGSSGAGVPATARGSDGADVPGAERPGRHSRSRGASSTGSASTLKSALVTYDAPGAGGRVGGFRGPLVCKLVGISYRQLDYWARTGLLTPSIAAATGSGSQRIYSYNDVLELKVVKQLLDSGMSLRQARRAVECLRSSGGNSIASSALVMSGSKTLLVSDDGQLVDILKGGQGVINVVGLADLVVKLDADIRQLPAVEQAGAGSEDTISGDGTAARRSESRTVRTRNGRGINSHTSAVGAPARVGGRRAASS